MPRLDDRPLEPDVAAALDALDATLAGDPVDPEYADLAELALLLSAEPPGPSPEYAAGLDRRVATRFRRESSPPPPRRRWLFAPGAAVAAAAVVVVVLLGHGATPRRDLANALSVTPGVASSTTASAGSAAAPAPGTPTPVNHSAGASRSSASAPGANQNLLASSGSSTSVGSSPQPQPSGARQVVRSAQVDLAASPKRIDDVAQQVFDVIGAEKGIVSSSNVTATGNSDSSASFQLSVPSANLQQTLSDLSQLRGARVVSRTDATSDITAQVGGAGERLAEARALRRSLLRQLAAASTTTQVDSLKLQIRDADASIASDLSTLRGLQRQVGYSKIALTIQAAAAPPPVPASGGTFTLGRAAHDAGRVLVVAAGVALVALAVLVPLGLVAALAAWVGLAVRRRRREQALDLI
jgi:hypothetical protein